MKILNTTLFSYSHNMSMFHTYDYDHIFHRSASCFKFVNMDDSHCLKELYTCYSFLSMQLLLIFLVSVISQGFS
jgi:hypothetical protein